MSVYIPRGGVHFRNLSTEDQKKARSGLANVCIRIPYKGYEISISCDDSCGVLDKDLARSDIRVFEEESRKDVTVDVMKRATTYADGMSLKRAMRNIDELLRVQA